MGTFWTGDSPCFLFDPIRSTSYSKKISNFKNLSNLERYFRKAIVNYQNFSLNKSKVFLGIFLSTVAFPNKVISTISWIFSVSKNSVKSFMKIRFALRNSLLVPKVECWKWSICWTPKICSPVRKRNTYVVTIKKCYGAKSK